ncbi:putative ABC transport system permease protein [Catalinimonas alkaloidigena]|uniref:Putative ABC transport system permease protein n=1 Tax=Catalinimonas alkaloidigena TaxID=1075417 RepID=A0A1G9UGA9_9BACT|nr:ABC transporter permease [Catalinimonas alkaloidigena]SDM58794.1 putative ABC transport system permease protein [Catalinimonas alkaloidigena]
MLRNYFLTAWRNLRKQKGYSFINILGLAVGVACCLLIVLFVQDELSYDRHFPNAERIFRVKSEILFGGNHMYGAVVQDPMAETLARDYPEVEASVRFREQGSFLVRRGTQENLKEEKVIYADSTLFQVFQLPMLQGNPQQALREPQTLLLSESAARRYFGPELDKGESILGQTLVLDNEVDYRVTGVVPDLPSNTHFHFDVFLSMVSLEESRQDNWLSHNFVTYVLLTDPAAAPALEAKMPHLIETHILPQAAQVLGVNDTEAFEASGNKLVYTLQPLTDIHLHSDLTAELEPNGSILYVWIFSAIAAFILLLACINFMNLATARAAMRAKEVGIRKAVGSLRQQLVGQFLSESVLVSAVAFVLAVALVQLVLPFYNNFTNKTLTLSLVGTPWTLPLLLVGALVVGLLAGSYPAFFLSAFQPIRVLKGQVVSASRGAFLRKGLVVFQFVTSIVLIIGTLVVGRQLQYIQQKKLGFNKEQVLLINDVYAMGNQVQSFKEEIKKLPGVVNASVTGYLPVPSYRNDSPLFPEGNTDQEAAVSMQNWFVDHDYINTFGMEIVAGRDFSVDFPSDSSAILLNESAARAFGFENPIGQRLSSITDFRTGATESLTIIGVVKDFHFESLRQHIGPLGMRLGRSQGSLSVRAQTRDLPQLITALETKWKALAPGQPFAYSFLDDRFTETYRTEQRLGSIFMAFAGLAIFIACLGLVGLATYTATQRTKEIGVRKVLGASVSQIVLLLSREFALLVGVAFLVSVPLSLWIMHRWLDAFAYRTDLSWQPFALAGGAALVVALLSVGLQSLKAARSNPVRSLRSE